MTHQLIKTDNYLLVVDDESKIKDGDYSFYWNQILKVQIGVNYSVPKAHKKIIYHLPLNNAPILEGVPLLPSLEDDARKLALEMGEDYFSKELFVDYFTIGYNKAKEKYKYTEEDLRKAFNAGDEYRYYENGGFRSIPSNVLNEDDFIQSLQQPKYPVAFESEMKCGRCHKPLEEKDDCWSAKECCQGSISYPDRLMTITNSQGLTQVVGKYIYL